MKNSNYCNIQQATCDGGFCVKVDGEATCTDAVPAGCNPPGADFECTSEGFFPDPSDCHRFYQCYKDDTAAIIATGFECRAPYVFDPSGPNNKFCRLTNGNAAYCSTVTCAANKIYENILMRFSWFPAASGQYVVSCIGGAAEFVTRCPAGLTANLVPIKPKCELVCTRSAIAAHPTDPTKYYECLYNSVTRTWVSTTQSCFKNYQFDEKLKTCVVAPACTNGATNPPLCVLPTTTTTAATPTTCTNGQILNSDQTCTTCPTTQVPNTEKDTCIDCLEGQVPNSDQSACTTST